VRYHADLERLPYNAAMSDLDRDPLHDGPSRQTNLAHLDLHQVDLHHVDPGTIAIWRWEAVITVLILSFASLVPFASIAPAVGAAIAGFVFVVGMLLAFWWPKQRYRYLRYGLDEFGLVLQSGVWWRKQITLPRVRIQHSDVAQGPLQRRYGVATLKLYTAGSRYTKVELEGVRHEEALALRDSLVTRARSNA
jgi:membrane protein YdbS with pleckstrin-like domain